jgi:hypothetical protein
MVGVVEPGDDTDSDGPTAPDAARDADATSESLDAEAARNADTVSDEQTERDAQLAQDRSSSTDGSPVAESATSAETPASTPDGAPTATQEPGPGDAAELAPGDVPAPPTTTLWAGEDNEALRERWREVQSRFVDDPHGAAAAADDLIGEAVDSITQALAEQRRQLGQWRAGGDFDTERLRVAVTGYRDFLDRVLSI